MQTNKRVDTVFTHEGGVAQRLTPAGELERTVLTCLLFENTFYESGNAIAKRIQDLIHLHNVDPLFVANLAVEARTKYYLRHVPLFLVRELARDGNGPLVRKTLPLIIQRADELTEFVALYLKEKGKTTKLTAGIKQGLATAFRKFNAYSLAKYNRDKEVTLKDVLFLCHAKPKDKEQEELWKQLISDTLPIPDTWEVAISAAKSAKEKKEVWERLLVENKLGGLALLRNLRNMDSVGVNPILIRDRLAKGVEKAFPYRFVVAAKHAPRFESNLEDAMFHAVKDVEKLPGITHLLVDVSGSMEDFLSRPLKRLYRQKDDAEPTTRLDVASGLAILLREKADNLDVSTFSTDIVAIPARRGFALRDSIVKSQMHGGTYLAKALGSLKHINYDRFIVITDEQTHDGIIPGWCKRNYIINVAPYQHGISYGNNWTHIDGWSERVFDYIRLNEEFEEQKSAG